MDQPENPTLGTGQDSKPTPTRGELIRAVGEILRDPQSRCSNYYALGPDEKGRLQNIDPFAKEACKFCLVGASMRVDHDYGLKPFSTEDLLSQVLGEDHLITIWDGASPAKQQQIVDRLINYNA